ncbi:hypothetical protein FACS1894178_4030 [Bacteroidia bacterium]|nr:hypothetical protein FACS1894178_4030 [Bacteroidia bacterium]
MTVTDSATYPITYGSTKQVDYIFAPSGLALIVKTHIATAAGKGVGGIGDGTATTQPGIPSGYDFYYITTDHLGSISLISNVSRGIVSRYYYQPFGGRVLLAGTDITPRGYTFHEHLTAFGLINMNGRMYDPVLARFLSPDPYVQMPDFTQNYNRYSYALNNPFKLTDPSGEFIHILAAALFGGIVNLFSNMENIDNFWQGLGYFMVGAGIGAGIAATGGALADAIQVGGIVTGAVVGATTGAVLGGAASYLQNGFNNLLSGNNFNHNGWEAFYTGAISGAITGAIFGGVQGYEIAKAGGKNLLWGNDIKYGRTKWSFFTSEKPYATLRWHLKNSGGLSENDCVPTTLTELEQYYGGKRTYEDFKTISGYIDGKGVESHISEVGNPIKNNFNAMMNFDPEDLLDYKQALKIMENDGVISTNMPYKNIRHADNIRSIKYYSNKIILRTRLTNFNLSTAIESSNSVSTMQFYFYLINGLK